MSFESFMTSKWMDEVMDLLFLAAMALGLFASLIPWGWIVSIGTVLLVIYLTIIEFKEYDRRHDNEES